MGHKKKFLIIGNINALTYKEIFPLFKNNEIWLGYNHIKEFTQPNGNIKKFGNVEWFTNLDIKKRHEKLILYKKYSPEEYPKYDNYDAINVNKVADIPYNYDGAIGVPVSFLDKYNPEQFEIIGADEAEGTGFSSGLFMDGSKYRQCYVADKRIYKRIFVRKKSNTPSESI